MKKTKISLLLKKAFVYFLVLLTLFSLMMPVYASQVNDSVPDVSNDHFTSEAIPELNSDELNNLCNYLKGQQFVETSLIDSVRCCGTYADMLIEYYYNSFCEDSSQDMPAYLSDAYSNVNDAYYDVDTLTVSSTNNSFDNFVISYSSSSPVSELAEKAEIVAEIFNEVYVWYCDINGFMAPKTNMNNVKYYVTISDHLNANGKTFSKGSGLSYIVIHENVIDEYMLNGTFLEGVIAHEFMHAILFGYGLESFDLDVDFAHEAMGQAAGIEYDLSYASRNSVCTRIETFLLNLGTSIGTVDNTSYMYGGSLFFLYLYETYGGWDIMKSIFEYYDSSYTIFENIDNVLFFEYDSSVSHEFRYFMVYCVAPDQMFEMSPYNYGISNASWGQPEPEDEYFINGPSFISGEDELEYLSGHFIIAYNTSSQTKRLVITVNYASNNNAIPEGTFMIYNSTTDTYIYSGEVVVGNELYGVFNLTCNPQDKLWIIICNAGLSGTLEYSYEISATNY